MWGKGGGSTLRAETWKREKEKILGGTYVNLHVDIAEFSRAIQPQEA